MTYQGDFTLPTELLKQIAANGFDQLSELIRIVVNATIQAERQQYLGAEYYQCTLDRLDQAKGYKLKQSRHVWERSHSMCHKCVKVVSTQNS